VAVLALFGVAFIPLWSPVQDAPTGPKDGLRVAAYNIRMGFGLDGTFAIEEQAQALRQLNAHVIVLSEVDRGWLLNGGHDDLRLLARRLGMQFVWAPAADEVWGDALLTSLPIKGVRNHVLVKGGPTGAQALEVDVRWDDRPLTIIATHLQPPADWSSLAQVEQLADIVRGARYPAIVAGDLNLEPGSPAWTTLIGAGLLDPFADVRPFNTAPSPEDPQQIDHILMNQGFTGTDPKNLDEPYSDHRPIAVTLVPLKTK
jgi:endonuclease/exonuclease/phosphatase family metal-dependent hydrolase